MANSKKKTTKKKSATSKKATTKKKVEKKLIEEKKKPTTKKKVMVKTVAENKNVAPKKKAVAKSVEGNKKVTTKKEIEVKPVEEKTVGSKKVTQKKKAVAKSIEENKKVTTKKKVEVKPIEEKTIEESINEEEKIAKKLLMFFSILILIIIIFFILLIINKDDNSDEIEFININLNKYLNLYKESNELEYIYITNNDCLECDNYEVNLKKIENEFKIKIKKLDISNFSDKDLKTIEDSNSFIVDISDVPILVAVKEKKAVSAINGIKEYSAIKNFISYSINPANKSFEKISVDKYLSLLKSKDPIIIYIGTSSDSACVKFSTTLEKVTSTRKVKVYYLNTDDLVTDSNIKKLNESNVIFSKQWFVPTILIVKNGSIKDYRMYAMSEEKLMEFLDKNKM